MENRLSVVTNTGTLSVTRFVYDGDGARVVQIKPDGSRVAYVGGLLEVEFRLPLTPTNLSIGSVSSAQINLTWVDASNNEGGFKLERSPNGNTWTEIATLEANMTAYGNSGLTCNTAYTYRIRAYNSAGNSNYSNTATATTATCATPPAAPGNLSGYASATEAALSWADNSGNEDGFKVERGTYWQGTVYWSEVALVGTNVTAYLDTGLESDTTYAYRVRAYNALGDSGYSNTIYVYTDGGSMMAAGLAASPLALTGQSSVPAGQIWKSYYRAGSTLIALRVDGDPITATNGLFFLHTDHLGSASLTTNATGGLIARQLYDAWGNVRTDTISGTMPTDVGYTGQYLDKSTGNLVFLNARYYLPASGRFISADSIVPGAADGSSGGAGTLGYDSHTRLTPLTTDFHEFIAQVSSEHAEVLQFGPFFQWSDKVRQKHNAPSGPLNPQALNRYAYTINNPLKYTDPSGHCFLVCGLIGAAAGFIGSVVSQVIQGEGTLQERIDNVNWKSAAVAGGVGFVAGTLTPLVATSLGAAALGADANVAQYVLTQAVNNEPVSAVGLAVSTASGFAAGVIVGRAPQVSPETILWDETSEYLDRSLAQQFNNEAIEKVVTGQLNLGRTLLGGLFSNRDWTK